MMLRRQKRSLFSRLTAVVFIVSLLLPFTNPAWAQAGIAGDIDGLALQAIRNNYVFYQDGQAVDGEWGNFSAYDAYILERAGADLASWTYDGQEFASRVISLIDSSIGNEGSAEQSSAKRIAGEYLAARSLGEGVRADALLQILQDRQDNQGDGSFDSSAFSDLPALEMLGRAGDMDKIDAAPAIIFILGEQDAVSGAWTSAWNDLMTTAQAIRALEYLKPYAGEQQQAVTDAIKKGSDWLQARQDDDGSFHDDGGWDDPVVDTAEVIYTLELLGIDPADWKSGAGKSPVDYLGDEAVDSDGVFGADPNIAANTWVLDAFLQIGAVIDHGSVLGIEINPASATINKGNVKQFTAQAYTLAGTTDDVTAAAVWTVANTNIASIDKGLVSGIAEGITTIRAQYGVSASADLTVYDLALQAIRNNYEFYQNGQAVDGEWGNFSAYDAYILKGAGADLASWTYDGQDFAVQVTSLIDSSINNEGSSEQSSAKRIAGEYLAARSLGEGVRADALLQMLQDRQDQQGDGSFDSSAFSDLPALEMLGRAGDMDKIDTAPTIMFILGEQDVVSGAWTSAWNDLMTTAQAIRALEYLKPYAGDQEPAVSGAISSGLDWLKDRQNDDGSFQDDGGWDDPVVDTAEVIYTLELLGINPADWVSGAGKSPVDYLGNEAVKSNGVFGANPNIAANTWVLDAFLQMGAVLDHDNVLGIEINPASATINQGNTQQFTAGVYTLDGTTEDVTPTAAWTVENTNIASVDKGLVTGIEAGATNITVASRDMTRTAVLSVEQASSGGGQVDNKIKVYIAVVGDNGELLFSPRQVTIDPQDPYGLTAVGALDATGLSWSNNPGLVTEIEGQKNQGMNGWMCKINKRPLSISAFESKVKQNDQVIWWYSYDPNSNGPDWEDLLSGNKSNSTIEEPSTSAGAIISQYSEQLEQINADISLINDDKRMTDKQANALKEKLDNNQVSKQVVVNEEEIIISDGTQEEITVLIPAQAVSGNVTITMEEVIDDSSRQQFALRMGSSIYHFGPDGSQFKEPITIGIKTPITEGLDIQQLSPAWYNIETKQWIPIPALIDLETGMVLFKINHFTAFAVLEFPARQSFADVTNDIAWAREAIEVLAGQGIIKGTGSGFEPGRYINRAEFVQLMAKALDLPKTSDSGKIFTDVKPGDWFAAAVETACVNEIISGYPDNTFRPSQPITRHEVASILQRLQDYDELPAVELNYLDQGDIPAWAVVGLKFTSHTKLMNGYEDGSFRGNNSMSRAEAAVTIYRYLNYLCDTGYKL